MPLKITLTLNTLIYIILLPFLEISPTHVFNPDWTGHARLHEVWQLATHFGLSIFSLFLIWRYQRLMSALFIQLMLNGGFLTAYALQSLYDGTMRHSNGSELLIGGVNPAMAVMAGMSLALVPMALKARKIKSSTVKD